MENAFFISVEICPSRFLDLLRQKISNEEIVGLLDRRKRFIARVPGQYVRFGQLALEGWRSAIDRSPEGLERILRPFRVPSRSAGGSAAGMSELADAAVRVGQGETVVASNPLFAEANAIGSALSRAL